MRNFSVKSTICCNAPGYNISGEIILIYTERLMKLWICLCFVDRWNQIWSQLDLNYRWMNSSHWILIFFTLNMVIVKLIYVQGVLQYIFRNLLMENSVSTYKIFQILLKTTWLELSIEKKLHYFFMKWLRKWIFKLATLLLKLKKIWMKSNHWIGFSM